jgi:hypothetical protein
MAEPFIAVSPDNNLIMETFATRAYDLGITVIVIGAEQSWQKPLPTRTIDRPCHIDIEGHYEQ